MNTSECDLVTGAWIARQLGVGRAAVANWRKRYPDFPQPVEGTAGGPLFSWTAVRQWLADTGKGEQLAAVGRTGTGTQRIGDASPPTRGPDRDLTSLEPRELLARVMVALLPRLGDGDPPEDDARPPLVLDPACRDPLLLLAASERFSDHVLPVAQAPTETDARTVRQALEGLDVRVGDALGTDGFAAFRGTARGVLCIPPTEARQWPAQDLAADPRWHYGLPEPGDPELAWVQHCLAHLRPRGVAVVVMPPVASVRPSGRHVRAALVRAGVLRDVIALPDGLTPSGESAVHLWVLQRGFAESGVRMTDLTALADVADVPSHHEGWEALFAAGDPGVVRMVPPLDLLDDDVALVPSRYVRPQVDGSGADLGEFTRRLAQLYAKVGRVLPQPVASPAQPRPAEVTLAELERSRALTILPRDATPRNGDLLFRTLGRPPVIATGGPEDERGVAQVVGIDTERLDPHFLAMFVRADANAAPVANTLGALTRDDVRRCRVPRLPLAEQQRYGDAFRRLQEVEDLAGRLAGLTRAVVAQAVSGLISGALNPSALMPRDMIDPKSDPTEKSTT